MIPIEWSKQHVKKEKKETKNIKKNSYIHNT